MVWPGGPEHWKPSPCQEQSLTMCDSRWAAVVTYRQASVNVVGADQSACLASGCECPSAAPASRWVSAARGAPTAAARCPPNWLISSATSCKKSIRWSVIDVTAAMWSSTLMLLPLLLPLVAVGSGLAAKANYKRPGPTTLAGCMLAAKTSDAS